MSWGICKLRLTVLSFVLVICKGCQAKSSRIDVFSSISVSIEKVRYKLIKKKQCLICLHLKLNVHIGFPSSYPNL